MEVLIAGVAGGREHALGLALHQEGASVHFTHGGNAGTGEIGANHNITSTEQIVTMASLADLVVVGPEAPLVDGLADSVRATGTPVFGPGRDGSQLEASKAFTAEFADAYGIRQPAFSVVRTFAKAVEYINSREGNSPNYVVKADGLAGGKGALLHDSDKDAFADVYDMLRGKKFGDAGRTIVFQDRLDSAGPELSAMYLLDGTGNFTLLPLSQDHKRLEDGDKGPNTGGMGAYAPLPFEAEEGLIDDVMDIGERIAGGLLKEGIDYRGVAYAGLMRDLSQDGKPSLLEINVRFGDPETQVVLARAQQAGVNMLELMTDIANGSMDKSLESSYIGRNLGGAALTICLAAGGYPSEKAGGVPILGLGKDYEGVTFHHGGTVYDEASRRVLAVGGRIGYITAIGKDADEADARAKAAIGDEAIHFENMRYRKDIAWQARTAA